MNSKDVIYIDIEDDITAIIGKVKSAGSKIVALVPPKRAGVLQSAVNLKLLQKAAQAADKRLVLITSDHSLITLAAGLKLPVARNLQSRPEIPHIETPAADTEEVIDGQNLPVGDFANSLGATAAVNRGDVSSKTAEEMTEIGDAALVAAKPEVVGPAAEATGKKGS